MLRPGASCHDQPAHMQHMRTPFPIRAPLTLQQHTCTKELHARIAHVHAHNRMQTNANTLRRTSLPTAATADAACPHPPGAAHQAPIRAAAAAGHLGIVRLLLRHGADAHCSEEGPLRTAASVGAQDVVEELLRVWHADVHANEDEALLWAVDNGHEVGAGLVCAVCMRVCACVREWLCVW